MTKIKKTKIKQRARTAQQSQSQAVMSRTKATSASTASKQHTRRPERRRGIGTMDGMRKQSPVTKQPTALQDLGDTLDDVFVEAPTTASTVRKKNTESQREAQEHDLSFLEDVSRQPEQHKEDLVPRKTAALQDTTEQYDEELQDFAQPLYVVESPALRQQKTIRPTVQKPQEVMRPLYEMDDLETPAVAPQKQEEQQAPVFVSRTHHSATEHRGPDDAIEDMQFEQHQNFTAADEQEGFSWHEIVDSPGETQIARNDVVRRFGVFAGVMMVSMTLFAFMGTSLAVKDQAEHAGEAAIDDIKEAVQYLRAGSFLESQQELADARVRFEEAQAAIANINSIVRSLSQFVPGTDRLHAGDQLTKAAIHLTSAGESFAKVGLFADQISNPLNDAADGTSLLAVYRDVMTHVTHAAQEVHQATTYIESVETESLPGQYQGVFSVLKTQLPVFDAALTKSVSLQSAIEDVLGANGPRKYLFLFQNNAEIRPTGGFIGSYGIMDFYDGQLRDFFIDGIYNPDGQLTDKVVPPRQIQKISAAWSLHDSNWFADFPQSAEKAIAFYERTGGPTTDGVIAITPRVIKELLSVTGPIPMEEYDVVLTHENFDAVTQYEVEEDYDKEENRPKKILADLAPIVIEKIFAERSPAQLMVLVQALSHSLAERDIQVYLRNQELQELIYARGWDGRMLQTDNDYMYVVNTNVNGFKTDAVVAQHVAHTAEIEEDGSVINTVTIERQHDGGHTGFEWYDGVNANYMRLYVPLGAELLTVDGHTREVNEERLQYDELGFERDYEVQQQEDNVRIHEATGTRIYQEYNKTVFGNWVYVSPQEAVRVTYRYRLPKHVVVQQDAQGRFGSYGVLFQKQPGIDATLNSQIVLPDGAHSEWASQERGLLKDELTRDRYHTVVYRLP